MIAERVPTPISATELRQFEIPGVRAKGKTLGGGAYGTVEEYDVDGVPCAGKRIHDVLVQARARDLVRRYVEECKLMAKLRHPNVVQFLGVCFSPESALPVLIMERLTTDLHGLLENTPNIPLSLKMSFLTDVARGLAYLHSHRPPIIHRDLSARNVLLNSSLVAKISDLGNSRIIDLSPVDVADLSYAPGASVYMPPEISEGSSRYGPSLDVLSFGHLGLFTATQVFPDDLLPSTYPDPTNPSQLIGRSEVERRERYFTLLHQQQGENHSLVKVIMECVDNDPHQRPTAEQLVSRLEEMSVEVQGPQDHTAKLQLMAQLRQIEDSELRQELDSVKIDREQLQEENTGLVREKEALVRGMEAIQSQLRVKGREVEEKERAIDTLLAERRMLQSQLREREDSIVQFHPQLRDTQQFKSHSLFDPTNTGIKLDVRQCANIPIATCYAQAVVIRGKVYVGGGVRKEKSKYFTYYNIFIYDTKTNSWSSIESGTSASALVSYNNSLVLVGGVVSDQVTGQLWVLGQDGHWQQPISPMPTPRAQASAVGYGQQLIVAGGRNSERTVLNTVEVYSGQQWMAADPMPRGYCVMKPAVLNGTLYLTGGNHGTGIWVPTNCDTSILSVSLQSLTERAASPQRDGPSPWNKLTDAPNKLMAVASTGGGLVAFGGHAVGKAMASVFVHKASGVYMYFPWSPTKSWVKIGELPNYTYSMCAVTLPSGEIMLCGGGIWGRAPVDTVYIVKVW